MVCEELESYIRDKDNIHKFVHDRKKVLFLLEHINIKNIQGDSKDETKLKKVLNDIKAKLEGGNAKIIGQVALQNTDKRSFKTNSPNLRAEVKPTKIE